jgi:hypothetical protein
MSQEGQPPEELKLVAICTTGYWEAQVMKSHLESEGIPAILQYESAGLIYGLTVDGVGQAKILVPEHLAQEAREIIGVEHE